MSARKGLLVKVCISKHLLQFSSHLNETCYTWSQCRVDVHEPVLMRVTPGVPELCPFLKKSNVSIKG